MEQFHFLEKGNGKRFHILEMEQKWDSNGTKMELQLSSTSCKMEMGWKHRFIMGDPRNYPFLFQTQTVPFLIGTRGACSNGTKWN